MPVRYSVIVPAYNAERTLGLCLGALMSQSGVERQEYEVIVVDDGSTDSTPAIAKSYDVRYFSKPNAGPASARNLGAREAKGQVILFTDADCEPTPDWLSEMVRPLEADPSVIAVKGAYRTRQRSLAARFAQVEFLERFEMLRQAPSIDMVDTYSAAFRLESFRAAGGFDESFPKANNEDTDLSYKLCRLGCRMVFNPEAIVYHMNHPDSPLKYARQKFWRGYWRMAVYKRYPDKMMKDTYTPKSLKLQTPLSLLALLSGLGSIVYTPMAILMAISVLGFGLTTLPFVAFAASQDLGVALTAPFMLGLRALSIGAGVLYYLINPRL